jgi:integrase
VLSKIARSGQKVMVRHPARWDPRSHVNETHLIVQKALKAVGLPTKGEGTHTIRRAVARAYFDQVARDKGDVAALRETSALLHHSSVATTEIYLGTTPEKESRDRRLKGKPFLSTLVPTQENVVPLRKAGEGE